MADKGNWTLEWRREIGDLGRLLFRLIIDTIKNLAFLGALTIIFFAAKWLRSIGVDEENVRQSNNYTLDHVPLSRMDRDRICSEAHQRVIQMSIWRRTWEASGVVDDYAKSWLLGFWVVVPFALVGYSSQVWLGCSFNKSVGLAFIVAIPSLVCGLAVLVGKEIGVKWRLQSIRSIFDLRLWIEGGLSTAALGTVVIVNATAPKGLLDSVINSVSVLVLFAVVVVELFGRVRDRVSKERSSSSEKHKGLD